MNVSALLNGDISNDLDGPITRFSRSQRIEVKYLEMVDLSDKVTIAH